MPDTDPTLDPAGTSGPTLHRDATRTSTRLRGVLTLLDTNPDATVNDVRLVLGRHALLLPLWGLALLSLPLTFIPFTSTLLGIPMLALTLQLALGRELLWLPRGWLAKPPPRRWMNWLYPKLIRLFGMMEWMLRRSYPQFREPPLNYLSNFLLVCLTLAIALPLPFGNIAPAIAILLLALGLMEEDGSFVAMGQIMGLLTVGALLVIVTLVIGAFGATNLLTGS